MNHSNEKFSRILSQNMIQLFRDWMEVSFKSLVSMLSMMSGEVLETGLSLKARCGPGCWTPKYEEVKYEEIEYEEVEYEEVEYEEVKYEEEPKYAVIATNFLISGRDGYDMVQNPDVVHEPSDTSDCDLCLSTSRRKVPS